MSPFRYNGFYSTEALSHQLHFYDPLADLPEDKSKLKARLFLETKINHASPFWGASDTLEPQRNPHKQCFLQHFLL